MKKFDFTNIDKYIELNKDKIETVMLGMLEDFFWTGFQYYGESKENVTIDFSDWATPIMHIEFKDGSEIVVDSYIDDYKKYDKARYIGIINIIKTSVMTQDNVNRLSRLPRYNLIDIMRKI